MRVAIYARGSTTDTGPRAEHQVPDLLRYATGRGYSLYKAYVEEKSAGPGHRSQFQALFADARRHRFDLVLFWSLDRFSRGGALRTLKYLNQLARWGVGYQSLTEEYLDSTGPYKEALVAILATLERVQPSDQPNAGRARKAALGVKAGPPATGKEVVREVRRLQGDGWSPYRIGKSLGLSTSTVAKYVAEPVEQEG